MDTKTLGEKIKTLRKKKGLTQKQLADAIPTSFSTFRRWEKDGHSPNIQFLSRLAEILNTSVAFLSGENDLSTNNDTIKITAPNTTKEQSFKVDKGMMTYCFSDTEKIEMPAIPELAPIFKEMVAERLKANQKS